jgi:hypothetical protein
MKNATKKFTGFLFPLFAVLGFFTIENAGDPTSIWYPAILIVIYSFLIAIVLRKSDDHDLAEHYTETIYFLGFLFTLMALFSLFRNFIGIKPEDIFAGDGTDSIFLYLGIAITTSIVGILFRNIIRSNYIRKHPQQEENTLISKIEELTKYSKEFTDVYMGVFNDIKQFLIERKEEVELLSVKESEYIQSLEKFNSTIDSFCEKLVTQENKITETISVFQESITKQGDAFDRSKGMMNELSEAINNIKDEIENLTFENVSSSLKEFRGEVKELDQVLDSIIQIIESKIKHIK